MGTASQTIGNFKFLPSMLPALPFGLVLSVNAGDLVGLKALLTCGFGDMEKEPCARKQPLFEQEEPSRQQTKPSALFG